MNKEDIENKLNTLRQKWIGKVPKNNSSHDYWKFRCDKCLAIGLKVKLEKWGNEIKSAANPEKDINEVAQMIFG